MNYPIEVDVEQGVVAIPEACSHGAHPFMVDIAPGSGEDPAWELFVLFACEHSCVGETALADEPSGIVNSAGEAVKLVARKQRRPAHT